MFKKLILVLILMISMPSIVSGQEIIIKYRESDLSFNSTEYMIPLTNRTFFDMDKLDNLIKRVEQHVYEPPTNALLNDNNNVIPEKTGVRLNRDQFKALLISSFYNASSQQLKLPTKIIYPKVDQELLSEIKTNELANYETYYKETNKERSLNIKLATKAIDNYVVFPNQTFSFNDVVGERTKKKGYEKAPVIVDGELAEDIGGGICQVSSTLFNAVNLQGIDIVERYSHSRSVPYVPPGKDATVSWFGPDFVFKNKLSHPILIRATSKGGKMIIKLYSSDHVNVN